MNRNFYEKKELELYASMFCAVGMVACIVLAIVVYSIFGVKP